MNIIRGSKDSNMINGCYISLSANFMQHGEPNAALRYGKMALNYFIRKADTIHLMDCYVNIGNAQSELGAGNAAVSNYFDAMRLAESCKDTSFLPTIYSSVGPELMHEGDYEKAKYFLEKALELEKKNNISTAGTLNNLGILYRAIGNYNYAERSYIESIRIARKTGEIRIAMQTFNNLAHVLELRNDLDSAEKCFKVSLRLSVRLKDRFQEELVLGNLGTLAVKKNEFPRADSLFKNSLAIAEEVNDLEGMAGMHLELAHLNKKTKKPELSVEHFDRYLKLKEELDKIDSEKGRQQAQLRYEYEKEKLELTKEQEKRSLIEESEKKKQRYILYSVSLGLIVVGFFAVSLYKRFKVTNEQKKMIEAQKKLVELKQKEVMDSIRYAKRIQMAQIPSEKAISTLMARLFKRK